MKRFGLFVGLALLTRLVLLPVPIVDLDEASYLTGSWELLRGGTLYRDVADHKPPLVYVYYAAVQLALGRGMLAVRLATHLLVVPLAAWALSAFFRHGRRGLMAALAFLAWSPAFLGHDMLAVNCELLALAPLALALLPLRDAERLTPARLAAAGLLIGIGSLFKHQAGISVLALSWVALRSEEPWLRRARTAVAPWLGLAVPWLLAWAAFARAHATADFQYWNLTHNLGYAANPARLDEAMARFAGSLLPFLAATAPLWWAAVASRSLLPVPHARLLTAWAALSLAAGFLGLRFYPHYWIPLYLPLALGAAPCLAEWLRLPLRPAGRWVLVHGAVVLLGFTAANAWLYYGRRDVYTETRPVFERVAARLRADPCFGRGPLFVWGYAPMFYSATALPPASRFLFVEATLVGHVSASRESDRSRVRADHWDWLMADLARKPPAYLLDTSRAHLSRWDFPLEDYPRLATLVATGYQKLDTVDHVVVYRRRDCPGPPAP